MTMAQNDSNAQQNSVAQAELSTLTDYSSSQDIQRVEDRVVETIGMASDGKP